MPRLTVAAAGVVALLALTACGGSDADPVTGAKATVGDPCTITTAAIIQGVVGGTVADGVAGAARNCTYAVTGGVVKEVQVYGYGPASDLDNVKKGYEANRGPLTEIAGLGTSAFSPGDVGANEVVVETSDVVFAVGLGAGESTPEPVVRQIAEAIVSDLG